MNTHIAVKYSTLFLVLCLLLPSCITYKEVEFKGVENVGVGKIKNNTIPISLGVRISNPNNFNIKIKKSYFDVYLEGQHLGKSYFPKIKC